jgi:formylglycine-generating enzyme required for sulfatase activity
MTRWIAGLMLLLSLGAAHAQQPTQQPAQPAAWDRKFYDPPHPALPAAPAGSELVLPMPCGGRMVFRAVEVPTGNGPLDDRTVPMGDPNRAMGIAEYIHSESLAAPFPAPNGGRQYWIGKFVVSRDQYAAMHGSCATPSFAGRVAQTEVSQIEAMDAAAAWTGWLLANARDSLPKRGRELGYVRLPTEVEWEFAARGGTRVSAEQFQDRTWPMPEGIEHYVVAGTTAGGHPQQIGAESLPNPLGLFGMLGSVDQMMLEPFRLNRVGRLHGEAGGIILRGGNYKANPEDLYTAARSEMRPFDAQADHPMRSPTVGFRLVLSAPTSGDIPEVEAERREFASLAEQNAATAQIDDPRQLVAAMRKTATNPLEQRAFDQLDARLAAAEVARGDQNRDTLRAEVEAATVMANFVWRAQKDVIAREAMIKYVDATAERQVVAGGGPGQVPAFVARFETNQKQNIAAIQLEQEASLDGYLQFLRQIATGPARQDMEAAAGIVRQEMDNRGQQQLKGFLPLVVRHVTVLRGGQPLLRDQVKTEILGVSEAGR